jgi:hypothetical protein
MNKARVFFVLLVAAIPCGAQKSLPPPLQGPGWQALIDGRSTAGWHSRDGKPHTWFTASDVRINKDGPRELLEGVGPAGPVMINGPDGRTTDFITAQTFGDIELYLEFVISSKSNSGVYFGGLYELQILDSFGVAKPGVHDCGAIYERWIDGKGVGGTAPLVNASRAPGEWQSFHVWFHAPRFDASGKKTADALFVRVEQNGVLIQQDVSAPGPTRASLEIPEASKNPIMLQGDHGPVAFRNVYVRSLP